MVKRWFNDLSYHFRFGNRWKCYLRNNNGNVKKMTFRVCKRTKVEQYDYLAFRPKGRLLGVIEKGLCVRNAMKLKRKKNKERSKEEKRIVYYCIEKD